MHRKLEELRLLLGHEDQKTTQRYAKLRVDLFPATAYSRVRVDFSAAVQNVIPIHPEGPIEREMRSGEEDKDQETQVS